MAAKCQQLVAIAVVSLTWALASTVQVDPVSTVSDPGPDANLKERSGASCAGSLEDWLRSIRATEWASRKSATLQVIWSDLDSTLKSAGCSDLQRLRLELWRVVNVAASDDDGSFGSPEYFAAYDRCRRLEPDHFAYHSSVYHTVPSAKAVAAAAAAGSPSKASPYSIFKHVVENRYMLRLCSCPQLSGGGGGGGLGGSAKLCNCEYGTITRCGPILDLGPAPSGMEIYPWCRLSENHADSGEPLAGQKAKDANEEVTEYVRIESPRISCESVLLSGTLTSCTPIQSYDRMRATFYQISTPSTPLATGGNDSLGQVCDGAVMKLNRNVVVVEQPLVDLGGGKGRFTVLVRNLEKNATFCVQVELVDHPYCDQHHYHVQQQQGFIFNDPAGDAGASPFFPLAPEICVNHIAQPIILPACPAFGGAATANLDQAKRSSDDVRVALSLAGYDSIIWTLILLGGTVVIGISTFVVLILFKYTSDKQRSSNPHLSQEGCSRHRNSRYCLCLSAEVAPLAVSVSQELEPLSQAHHDSTTNVFLLYFLESKRFEKVNSLLGDWLVSQGCTVFDLNSPEHEERINEDPEGWVSDVLGLPDLKVIVLDSQVARATVSRVAKDGINGMYLAVPKVPPIAGTRRVTSISLSSMDTENQEQLVTPNLLGARLISSEVALPQALPESAVEDSYHELRVYALRRVIAHFNGRYKDLVVAKYPESFTLSGEGVPLCSAASGDHLMPPAVEEDCTGFGDEAGTRGGMATPLRERDKDTIAANLTPHRQSLLLPHHLPELRSWIHGQGPFPSLQVKKTEGFASPSLPLGSEQVDFAQLQAKEKILESKLWAEVMKGQVKNEGFKKDFTTTTTTTTSTTLADFVKLDGEES